MRRQTVAITAVLALTSGAAVAKQKDHFFIQGAKLAKQADGTWAGDGTLDGVKGKVTLSGAPDPATDAVEFQAKGGFHHVRWTWVAGKRRVAGCSRNRIIIRPNGVLLWDSSAGKITKTSAQERKYLGRKIALYGPTKKSDPTHAQISIDQVPPDQSKGSC